MLADTVVCVGVGVGPGLGVFVAVVVVRLVGLVEEGFVRCADIVEGIGQKSAGYTKRKFITDCRPFPQARKNSSSIRLSMQEDDSSNNNNKGDGTNNGNKESVVR